MDWSRFSRLSLHNKMRLMYMIVRLLMIEGKATLDDYQWGRVARATAIRIRKAAMALAA